MLDEKKLMKLIATTPLIRTVQLADAMDCDIDQIEDELRPLLNRGRIISVPVMGPNNRKATGYVLSDAERSAILQAAPSVSIDGPQNHIERAIAFIRQRGTSTSAELHAHLDLAVNDMVSEKLAAAIIDGRLVKRGKFWGLSDSELPETIPTEPALDVPVFASQKPEPSNGPPPTKADLAVACIKCKPNERASSDHLRAALGLRADQHPSAWLTGAIKSGRLVRDGEYWTIGSGQPSRDRVLAELAELATRHELVEALPCGSNPALPEPEPVAALIPVEAPVAPMPTPAETPRFRVGDWSDGTVELQRDGVHLASLSADEFEQIGKFWNLRAA